MRTKHLIILYGLILLLTACRKEDGVNTFQHVSTNGWNASDTLHFEVPPSSHAKDYDLQVQVRIDRHYAYRDLWLEIGEEYRGRLIRPSQKDTIITRHHIDTVHVCLTDPNDDFDGKGNNLLNYLAPVHFLRLRKDESGTVYIRHIMDDKTIRGVHDVGITLLPVKEK